MAPDDQDEHLTEIEAQTRSLDDLIAEAQRLRIEINLRLRSLFGLNRPAYSGPERRSKPR